MKHILTLILSIFSSGLFAGDISVLTAYSFLQRSDVVFIDVRSKSEFDEGHINGALLIPLDSIVNRASEIPKDKTIILYCRSGRRSMSAYNLIKDQNFKELNNMLGGIVAWKEANYPVIK